MSISLRSTEQQADDDDNELACLDQMLDDTIAGFSLCADDPSFGPHSVLIIDKQPWIDAEQWRLTVQHAIDTISLLPPVMDPSLTHIVPRNQPILPTSPEFQTWISASTRTSTSVSNAPRIGLWVSSGARIPQELFDIILLHATSPLSSSQSTSIGEIPCSLVCRYWANKYRKYRFSGATLLVRSCEEAERLVQYALHGHPLLVPIHTLVSGISVEQNYSNTSSFLHHVFRLLRSISGKQPKFDTLHIEGPIPGEHPSCKLDTPHWSFPSSIPTPPSMLPYGQIRFWNVRLPSFKHASKYISHFRSATSVCIDSLTWEDDEWDSATRAASHPRVRRGNFYKMRNECFQFSAYECTDNLRLTLHALITNTRSPLYAVSDDPPYNERNAFVEWLQGFSLSTIHYMKVQISYLPHSLLAKSSIQIKLKIDGWELTFTLEDRAFDGSPTPNFHVVGLEARVSKDYCSDDFNNLRLDDIVPHLRRYPMLHAIAIILEESHDSETVLLGMKPYRPVPFHPLIASHKYILVLHCDSRELVSPEILKPDDWLSSRFIGIDPVTFSPTGQVWAEELTIIPSLLDIPVL